MFFLPKYVGAWWKHEFPTETRMRVFYTVKTAPGLDFNLQFLFH